MTPDQLFIIALLTIIVPILTTALTIGGGILMFREQNRKLDAATDASKKAEVAANHSKDEVKLMQENFKAAINVIAPHAAAVANMRPAAPPAVAEMNVVAESVTVLPTTAVDKEK